MKYIIIILAMFLLTGCNHWKWVMRHQDEVCAKCPQKNDVETTETDTTYYDIIPADTLLLEGLDFPNSNDVLIDNNTYKVIKEKGKTIVIFKEKRVPIVVTKFRDRKQAFTTVKVNVPYVPFVYYLWLIPAFILGWFVKCIVGLFKRFV